jgi:hypothetical protein
VRESTDQKVASCETVQVRHRFCKPIRKRDTTEQVETEEMRRVPLDRSHRIRRGQPTRQRPPIARAIAQMALAALGLSGDPVDEPVHARDPASHILLLCVNVADDMDPRPQADRAPGPTVDLYAATHTVRSADARICRTAGVVVAHIYASPGILTRALSALRTTAVQPYLSGW